MKYLFFVFSFLLAPCTYADIYDDFIEINLVSEPRKKFIALYQSSQIPEGYNAAKWNEGTRIIVQKLNTDLSINGAIFSAIKDSYKTEFTADDMKYLIEVVSNPKFRALLSKNLNVKSNVTDILHNYMYKEFGDVVYETRADLAEQDNAQ